MDWLWIQAYLIRGILVENLNEAWAVNLLEFASILVLSGTLYFSLRAVRVAEEGNDLKLLPVLIIKYSRENSLDIFHIKNIGSGTAFNVKVEPLSLYLSSLREWYTLEFLLAENHLEHNQIRRLQVAGKKKGKVIDHFGEILLAVFRQDSSPVTITFTDARGKWYYCKVKIKKERVILTKLPVSLTNWRKGKFYLNNILDKFATQVKADATRYFQQLKRNI